MIKIKKRKKTQIRKQTWWIGGYIELVQTGHSNNSWTLVAGAIPGTTDPIIIFLLWDFKGYCWCLWLGWWWISSSSIPSDDDTHSILSISIPPLFCFLVITHKSWITHLSKSFNFLMISRSSFFWILRSWVSLLPLWGGEGYMYIWRKKKKEAKTR